MITIKTKIAALIAALAMALGLSLAAPPTAMSAIYTDVTHAGDDSGYTAPIHIVCRNNYNHIWLGKGDSSFASVNTSCGGLGVHQIVVGYNQAVRCFNLLPPYQSLYYMQGTREVPSYASLKCYMQRPL